MTSTRSSKWVLFSALQREGRRMSVWLALFPFLGFLYALCHGLLQALMNQDTDTVAAQDQTVRIFGSIALFLSAATIMAGAFFAISAFRFLYSRRQSDFYLSLPVTRRTFYFVKWVIGELVLLLAFCGAGIGCWLVPQLIPRKWHVQLDAGYGLRLLAVAFAAAAAFYCICLLCAVTAGKVWQYWTLLIGIGGCLPLGLISYAELFPAFLSGLNQQPVRIVALVSPIAYVPFGVQGVFDFRYLLLAALLVGVVSFFAGLFFYRRRSGECAEQTLSTPVVYVLATTGAALSLVCLPMLLTLQANQYGVYALLCGAGVGVMTLVCTLVYTHKVVNPTAAVLCSTLVVVTVGTVCLLGVQGSDYRNKVPAAEDVAQVTVQPMVEDPLVYLPNQSGGANRTLKLLQKDGFIYGAQTTLPSADQVETMLVSPICTLSADYTEGDGCLLGEPDSEDGYYLTRPESLLGGQVVRKNFASLYTDPFRTVTDRKAIARTLAGVQPGADQMERLKKAKQGYAVSLITKDGKATKMYFVPIAYGYEQGKPTTDDASDLAYALG